MDSVVFDYFSRPVVVETKSRELSLAAFVDTVVLDSDALVLRRLPVTLAFPEQDPLGLVLHQPVPEPMQVHNTPPTHTAGDGSYDYIPDVSGGYAPYTFELVQAPDETFEFKTGSGELSRPPQ